MNLPDISNPLPDTLHVKVDKPENIDVVFNNIKWLTSVEDMSYAQDLAKRIQTLNHVVNTITVFVVINHGIADDYNHQQHHSACNSIPKRRN